MIARLLRWWHRRTCRAQGYPCDFCPNNVNFKGWGTPVLPYLEYDGPCRWVPLGAPPEDL